MGVAQAAFQVRTAFKIVRRMKNWETFFGDYFGIRNRPVATYTMRDGTRLTCRTNIDRLVINDVLINGVYNPDGYEIRKGDVVVDIGAQIGVFSVLAAKRASKVYSFEPDTKNYSMLQQNSRQNRCRNIKAFRLGVAKSTGKRSFYVSPSSWSHSLFSDVCGGKKVTINTISLPEFMAKNKLQRIDFLKMDCEGAEFEIIYSLPPETLERIKRISMEYHEFGNNKLSKLRKYLERNGYSVDVRPPIIHATRS